MLLTSCTPENPVDQTALENEAAQITRQFVGTLLPTLQQALQNGGPANAIEVCSVQAPSIAATLSAETGWQVRRVSLKTRNSSLATPDSWETAELEAFDRRQQAGEAGPGINTSAIVDGEFRYLQAQPVMPLCLNCHGDELSSEVTAALQQHYPDDLATGYSLGQIRGAISLQKRLD
ncbi:MAG: DUF3365 domain-containing protein [Gammaproteobacteria bacterium]|nr:DUF3365 domain-containing protein [Gammaproteobacteria bacterium]